MISVPVELPESVFSALRFAPDEFVREMRLAAAVKWYELDQFANRCTVWGGFFTRRVIGLVAGRVKNPPHTCPYTQLQSDLGKVSQGKAAEIAGLSRAAFIETLARFQVSPFQYTAEEIAEEF